MTRYEATRAIYEVINSGILHEELEESLAEVVNCICEKGFDKCPAECLRYCKLDECPNADDSEEISELIEPPNDPMTMEELREMDGEPVWVVRDVVDIPIIRQWGVVNAPDKYVFGADFFVRFDDYGDWFAYRRRPRDVHHEN